MSRPVNEVLAKARADVAAMVEPDTAGQPQRWRVVITDSESPTGVALVCTGDRSNALHMIDDYPGGPVRDEDGVYDCCPWPQFDTYSAPLAVYLVELLNADAGEEATADAATATPDFFQPGHTYQHSAWSFRCDTVTSHPDTGERTALGWFRFRQERWRSFSTNVALWADGWTDVAEAGEPR